MTHSTMTINAIIKPNNPSVAPNINERNRLPTSAIS